MPQILYVEKLHSLDAEVSPLLALVPLKSDRVTPIS